MVLSTAWWTVLALGVAPALGTGPVLAAAGAGYLLLIEGAGRAPGSRERATQVFPAAGLLVACVFSLPEAAWSAGLLGVVGLWALLRRRRPWPDPGSRPVLGTVGGVAPVLALMALARATDPATAVAVAVVCIAAATLLVAPSRLPRAGRYGVLWWRTAMVLVTLGAFQAWVLAPSSHRVLLVAALAGV
ncbi:hypothetical protein, partial [Cellulomonas bogoriensis]|uniref:hypothetical protein n=1 Tax=Cellulomonas bogoriensis TaxID=301388 RepID=UPI0018DBCA2C